MKKPLRRPLLMLMLGGGGLLLTGCNRASEPPSTPPSHAAAALDGNRGDLQWPGTPSFPTGAPRTIAPATDDPSASSSGPSAIDRWQSCQPPEFELRKVVMICGRSHKIVFSWNVPPMTEQEFWFTIDKFLESEIANYRAGQFETVRRGDGTVANVATLSRIAQFETTQMKNGTAARVATISGSFADGSKRTFMVVTTDDPNGAGGGKLFKCFAPDASTCRGDIEELHAHPPQRPSH